MTVIGDPFLDKLGTSNPDLCERIIEGLLESGDEELRAALAQYERIGPWRLERLAHDSSGRVRAAVGGRTDCSAHILEQLAGDSKVFIRCTVASNTSASQKVLTKLATDWNARVRYNAFHNPSADEEVRAAATLLSRPDELKTSPLEFSLEDEASDPETPAERLREIAELALEEIDGRQLRSALAMNPNLPEELIPDLVKRSWTRGESRAWWERYSRHSWPSTKVFLLADAPEWVISALAAEGHPAALLREGCPTPGSPVDAAQAVMNLVNSELLIYALWRELAAAGKAELVYWRDSIEGDRFFAQASLGDGTDLTVTGGPAERILGGWSANREWISLNDRMTLTGVAQVLGVDFENWIAQAGADRFDESSLNAFTIGGLAYLVINQRPSSTVQLTSSGIERFEDVKAHRQFEAEDCDTVVSLVKQDAPLASFGSTSEAQKLALVDLLQAARSNILLDTWGISDHFLKCIALHPKTPESVLLRLAEDADQGVCEVARLALSTA